MSCDLARYCGMNISAAIFSFGKLAITRIKEYELQPFYVLSEITILSWEEHNFVTFLFGGLQSASKVVEVVIESRI